MHGKEVRDDFSFRRKKMKRKKEREKKKEKRKNEKRRLHFRRLLRGSHLRRLLAVCRTNVDFKEVALMSTLTSAAQTSQAHLRRPHKRRCALTSMLTNVGSNLRLSHKTRATHFLAYFLTSIRKLPAIDQEGIAPVLREERLEIL
jgi:hypothetical protein